jgi:hypothetical protein
MNDSLAIKLLCFFLLFSLTSASAQQMEIVLRCHPTTAVCDTFQISEKNERNLLVKKVNRDKKKDEIRYFYDTSDRLIRKEVRDSTGQLQRINHISYSGNNWESDSLFDEAGRLLLVLKQNEGDSTGLYIIKWYFNYESVPSAEQRIKRLPDNTELSNSTCYAPDNCITFVYYYREGRRTLMETWVLQPELSSPRLTESEEYIYDTSGKLSSTIRFFEPDHRNTAVLKHYYYTVP